MIEHYKLPFILSSLLAIFTYIMYFKLLHDYNNLVRQTGETRT